MVNFLFSFADTNYFVGGIIALLSFGLYLLTLSPTYLPIDSPEFTLCSYFWGVCHPPGFPLYVLISKIFISAFPFGSVVWKANLLSSVFASLTIYFVFLIMSELKIKRFSGIIFSLLLASSLVFWEFAVKADIFSFATLLLSITLWLALRKRVYLSIFFLGLSASHFYITAVLLPFLIYFHYQNHYQHKLLSLKNKILLFVGLLVIFSSAFFPQLIMFWRMQNEPVINWGSVNNFSEFIYFVSRKEFGSVFLVSNPVLLFSLDKFFKHILAYLTALSLNLGIVLPIILGFNLFISKIIHKKEIRFFSISFLLLVSVQLFLISTIDPLDQNSPFEIDKFYLVSFVLATVLMAVSFDRIVDNIFSGEIFYPGLILLIILAINLIVNFQLNNYSRNYFSQNLVIDALGQLPDSSLAIVLDHTFYFGALYEQLINNRFTEVKILYFPNQNNRDNEARYPELFGKKADSNFVAQVKNQQNFGQAETYILETIAKNLDKPIFILQGEFENNFFAFLDRFLIPHGLWWRINPNQLSFDLDESEKLLSNLKNKNFTLAEIRKKSQRHQALIYPVAFRSLALAFATQGQFDKAGKFLKKSLDIDPDNKSFENDFNLIIEVEKGWSNRNELFANKDKEELMKLGQNLYTIKNFKGCVEIYLKILSFSEEAKLYSNLASCYALSGDKESAKVNYLKALEFDPSLELAKQGLENLND